MPLYKRHLLALTIGAALSANALAEDKALDTFQVLTPETALTLAQETLKSCRAAGFQIAVTVVDRMGIAQVMLRDRYAGAHTPDTATRKAWTAVSFRTDTLALTELTKAGAPQSGVRFVTNALMIGGGVPIEVGGSLVGAVGVSGAPGGQEDDKCARAGIAAIHDKLIF